MTCTRDDLYQTWLVPEIACTSYCLYPRWLVPYIACTRDGLYQIWLVPEMACTIYDLYQIWHVPEMACTICSLYTIDSLYHTVYGTVWATNGSWSVSEKSGIWPTLHRNAHQQFNPKTTRLTVYTSRWLTVFTVDCWALGLALTKNENRKKELAKSAGEKNWAQVFTLLKNPYQKYSVKHKILL